MVANVAIPFGHCFASAKPLSRWSSPAACIGCSKWFVSQAAGRVAAGRSKDHSSPTVRVINTSKNVYIYCGGGLKILPHIVVKLEVTT